VRELTEAVRRLRPDVVAVSGDLTQRARRHEFERARLFLETLPKPQIVVPGNHDVPMHNIFARFRGALKNYRRYISDDLEPMYADEEIAMLGLNTARSLTIKGGRVNHRQIARVEESLGRLSDGLTKIIVTHHPFDLPATYAGKHLVGRAAKAMARFARSGVDVFLAGHFHVSYCGRTAERYSFGQYSAIFVQAGTACSTRGRGEPNAFNVIRTEPGRVSVETMSMKREEGFRSASFEEFRRTEGGWSRTLPPQNTVEVE
jgi:3',5'-cyclic AMP phosphodiesterase CpdA